MITIDEYEFDESLYYYTPGDGHIWVKKKDNGNVLIGFDDFGQQLAGKILFVRTIPAGNDRAKGSTIGTIETGKYVGALKCPINGEIIEINPKIKNQPDIINEDPYGEGWIAEIKPSSLEEDLKEDFVYGEDALREWIKEEIKEHA
ncbi:MAG: glycine cleavage system protein H [Asgard group archaeon]|nr:glycine cleavage system protein H [Asgard group archaeon]